MSVEIKSLLWGVAFLAAGFAQQGRAAEISAAPCRSNPLPLSSAKAVRVENLESKPGRNFKVYWKSQAHTEGQVRPPSPEVGAEVVISRCVSPGKWATVAKGLVIGRNGAVFEADVEAGPHSEENLGEVERVAVQSGNLYWRPMAGDYVVSVEKSIASKIQISPLIEMGVDELFARERAGRLYSFDLSEKGKTRLREEFERFRSLSGRLIVEGFLSRPGDRDDLRTESRIRAKSVADYLQQTFELQDDRIAAMGYGGDLLPTGMRPVARWPKRQIEEGIVLRLLPK
jgi:hypothetical protein